MNLQLGQHCITWYSHQNPISNDNSSYIGILYQVGICCIGVRPRQHNAIICAHNIITHMYAVRAPDCDNYINNYNNIIFLPDTRNVQYWKFMLHIRDNPLSLSTTSNSFSQQITVSFSCNGICLILSGKTLTS